MGAQDFAQWEELGGKFGEQMNKVTFGYSQDKALAEKYNCVGEHEMDETPGSGTHKEWDFCILTWKAFHNNVMGGFGVNEDRKMFDAGSTTHKHPNATQVTAGGKLCPQAL